MSAVIGNAIPLRGLTGDALRSILINDAKKTLKKGTPYQIQAWTNSYGEKLLCWISGGKKGKVIEECIA